MYPVLLLLACTPDVAREKEAPNGFTALPERVNIQADSARMSQVIDNEWVAVGIRKDEALGLDHSRMYGGKPSYRFTLGRDDNTLEGYAPGETKGRSELAWCYATAADFAGLPDKAYSDAQRMKTVYHHGKGICPQGTSWSYTFAVRIPAELSPEVSTIFAQWHGMPDRTLVTAPDGRVMKLPAEEFLAMQDTVIIKKDIVYERVETVDTKGNKVWKVGKPTGWKVEQGGYPPLAFGFSNGYFYIKANSDRRWFTDKTDRCNANAAKGQGDGSRHLGVQSLDDRRADALQRVPEGPLGHLHRGDRLDAVRRRSRDDRASGTPRRMDGP